MRERCELEEAGDGWIDCEEGLIERCQVEERGVEIVTKSGVDKWRRQSGEDREI